MFFEYNLMNSLLASIKQFKGIEKDFKLVKSSGKFNELCNLLTYILNYSKISPDSMKLILVHAVDSLSEHVVKVPDLSVATKRKDVKAPNRSLNLRVNTVKTERKNFSERLSFLPDSIETPKSINSVVIAPDYKSNEVQLKPNKSENSILSISFSSPTNESVQKKLENSKYSFSKQVFS